jgi:DNA-binding transcriptional LysR family regulator
VILLTRGVFQGSRQKLHLTISGQQQVRALEDRFNRKLVERSRGGAMSPTAAGMTFYQGCREILDRFNSLNEEMKGLGNIISGQVRVGTIYSVGIHELSPVLKRFIKSYPQVNVHIEYMPSQ